MPPRPSLILPLIRRLRTFSQQCFPKSRGISSSVAQSLADLATRPTSKYQIYSSQSDDPFLNLSIEHFLLQKTPAHSTVLFFYVNRPCVVIGRNQNPWLEADLKLLANRPASTRWRAGGALVPATQNQIDLIRRRSGGGAVFHDGGNVNYCVICPTEDFTRDKHVEMVVEALRRDNPRTRVNERHDIVLDQGRRDLNGPLPDANNMHETMYQNDREQPALKVSGSAYKLTRTRSLHHGTCLLESPNLQNISRYLRSPARPFMKARGVDSVRSPVGNVYQGIQDNVSSRFQRNVVEVFGAHYGLDQECLEGFRKAKEYGDVQRGQDWICGSFGTSMEGVPEVQAGMRELQSLDWIYGQTPQFVLSSHACEEDERPRPALPAYFPSSARVLLKIRSGTIDSAQISFSADRKIASSEAGFVEELLKGARIHEIENFYSILQHSAMVRQDDVRSISHWLNTMLAIEPACPGVDNGLSTRRTNPRDS